MARFNDSLRVTGAALRGEHLSSVGLAENDGVRAFFAPRRAPARRGSCMPRPTGPRTPHGPPRSQRSACRHRRGGHHVIYRAGILESQRTNHAPKQSAPSSPVKPLCFVAGTDPIDSGCSNVEKRFRFRRTQWVGTANAIGWRAYVHLASSRTAPVPGPCRAPRPWPPCAGGTRPDGQGGGRRAGVTNRGTAVFCNSLPPSSY